MRKNTRPIQDQLPTDVRVVHSDDGAIRLWVEESRATSYFFALLTVFCFSILLGAILTWSNLNASMGDQEQVPQALRAPIVLVLALVGLFFLYGCLWSRFGVDEWILLPGELRREWGWSWSSRRSSQRYLDCLLVVSCSVNGEGIATTNLDARPPGGLPFNIYKQDSTDIEQVVSLARMVSEKTRWKLRLPSDPHSGISRSAK